MSTESIIVTIPGIGQDQDEISWDSPFAGFLQSRVDDVHIEAHVCYARFPES